MPPAFQSVTWLEAQQELALRLNDTAMVRWTKAEIEIYLSEALRVWNCLTQQWLVDWATTYTQPPAPNLPVWNSLANPLNPLVGSNPTSPRDQSLTDAYVYTVAQYHLLEPPTGNSAWTGTSQFTLNDFVNAFTRRRDQILQLTACNTGPFDPTLSITPGTNRIELPDSPAQSILDVRRVRYIPDPSLGSPATLYRDDLMSFEYFTHDFNQTFDPPLCWDFLGSPQQFLTFDSKPNIANNLDCLAVLSGGVVAPPVPAHLLIPDDFYWVLKFGMLADMLSKETESRDLTRAQYCQQRFDEGVRLMMEMPWLTQARINDIPVDTLDFYTADELDYEWQSNPDAQVQIIRGGIDLFAVSPIIPPDTAIGLTLTLVGNMPIPASDADFIQVSPEVINAIIDEAQHLAQFKEAGQEFMDSIALHQRFIKVAMETNSRLDESGIFPTDIRRTISKEDEADPRFALAAQGESKQ